MFMFEIVAIWAIIAATLVWFVRDERRRRAAALAEKARFYARAPKYRHVSVSEPLADLVPVPARRTGALTREQRDAFERMLTRGS
jgi:hypothetical protein